MQSLPARSPAPAQVGVQVQVRFLCEDQQRAVVLLPLDQQLLNKLRPSQAVVLSVSRLGPRFL